MNPTKTALITGASSGIGFEFAHLFAQHGYDLILVARKREELQTLANDLKQKYQRKIQVISKDLSLPEAAKELYQETKKLGISIDILINNAGFAVYGEFAETDLQSELGMIQLNITTLTELTKLFLIEMKENNSGKILNVASTAAFQPGPLMAVYYATKAFVLSFSEAIRSELEGTNITISTLCPGPTSTGFAKRAKLDKSRLFNNNIMDAKTVAIKGFEGLMNKKPIIIPGLKNKFFIFAERFTPRFLLLKIIKAIQAENH